MKRMNPISRIVGLVTLASIGLAPPALAQKPERDLTQVSLEDLMNIEITSASRKEQRATDVAAAVFVITSDDIRRSGMTTVPDLLRLAPGVDVAQINSNKWAVSVRGFNANFANKLLVLVDGRSIYNQIFSGVTWDTEDLMVDDIERIEVIRGPGAVMWGANAVNAVINIVTKAAGDTQGGLVRVDGGRAGEQGAVRYGGTLGAARYRVYSQWSERNESIVASGALANDASHSVTNGFRADWAPASGALILDGNFTAGQARALWPNLDPQTAGSAPMADTPSDTRGGHLLARWTHTGATGKSLQLQSTLDIDERLEPIGDYHHRSFNLDAQYHTLLGKHQDLVVGAGSRFIAESFFGHTGIAMTPAESVSSLVTAFAQDEIGLFDHRLAVTLGSQVQYDSQAGAGLQPTARVIWKGLPRQRLWAATSRALRTPALDETGFRLDYAPVPTPSGLPLFVTSLGNSASKTETFVDAEAGYRLEIGTMAAIDITGFAGRYDHLVTQEVGAPVVQFVPSPEILVIGHGDNLLAATTRGLEVAGHWSPAAAWRFDASYTAFHLTPHLAAGSLDPLAGTYDGDAPGAQWQLRSGFSPTPHTTLNLAIFHVGSLEQMQVAAYTRADLNAEWRFVHGLSLMAIGQNLSSAAHVEFAGPSSLLMATQVPRSVSLRMRWAFR
jgi:iron complex outermembrane receptor protein